MGIDAVNFGNNRRNPVVDCVQPDLPLAKTIHDGFRNGVKETRMGYALILNGEQKNDESYRILKFQNWIRYLKLFEYRKNFTFAFMFLTFTNEELALTDT